MQHDVSTSAALDVEFAVYGTVDMFRGFAREFFHLGIRTRIIVGNINEEIAVIEIQGEGGPEVNIIAEGLGASHIIQVHGRINPRSRSKNFRISA